jgi:VanZ like family
VTRPQASRAKRPGYGGGPASLLWVGLALALALATLLVFRDLPRFEPVETAWPFDSGFAAVAAPERGPATDGAAADGPAAAGWEVEGDPSGVSAAGGVLRLRNLDPEGGVGVRQLWRLDPEGPRVFRLAATVASDGIAGQRRGFRVGEVTLVADADIGRPFFRPIHRLAALHGTREPARYVQQFAFPGSARAVELAIRLRHATGELAVGRLELQALRERPAFARARVALQLAWGVALAAGGLLFWRGVDHWPSALVLLGATAGSLVLLMMPEGVRGSTALRLIDLVPGRLVGVDGAAYLGHFAVFAVAGFLLRLSRRREPWLRQLPLLVGLAGLAELLQFLAELRSPALDDWLANAAGALLGWLPATAWLWWRQDGQFATQRRSSTTVPPQAAKQRL